MQLAFWLSSRSGRCRDPAGTNTGSTRSGWCSICWCLVGAQPSAKPDEILDQLDRCIVLHLDVGRRSTAGPAWLPLSVKPPLTETVVFVFAGVELFASCSNSNRVSLITRSLSSCVSLI